jgi:hypothetical protein
LDMSFSQRLKSRAQRGDTHAWLVLEVVGGL